MNSTINVLINPHPASIIPFIFLVICMAIFPLTPVINKYWESNLIKLIVVCILSLPIWLYYCIAFKSLGGVQAMFLQLLDWFNFVSLIGSLYVVAGGIYFDYDHVATPFLNVLILLFGTVLANFTGTTGACMILIRTYAHVNKNRLGQHHIAFFIILIANVGGVLTPLGDPPMFIGFLKGVPFFWMVKNPKIVISWVFCVLMLLLMFFFWDLRFYRKYLSQKDEIGINDHQESIKRMKKLKSSSSAGVVDVEEEIESVVNKSEGSSSKTNEDVIENESVSSSYTLKGKEAIVGFILIILSVALQGLPGFPPGSDIYISIIASLVQIIIALTFRYTIVDPISYELNLFSVGPILEVCILFFGLFSTLAPVLGYLQFNAILLGIKQPWQYFWISGALSAVLDNAPTYFTFASMAAGLFGLSFNNPTDVDILLNSNPLFIKQLTAISIGSVFFGCGTYIGNAPNLIVKSTVEGMIKKEGGYPKNCIPNFFQYMVWVLPHILPLFLIVTFIIEA